MNTTASKYDHASFPGSPLERARHRELALANGLRALAASYALSLKEPLHIDSLGEFNLFLVEGQCYGEALSRLLSKHNPRCGIHPTKYLDGVNSWCRMNHFDVQRLLDEAGI